MKHTTKRVKIKDLVYNRGQLEGLPGNPRFVRDENFELMKKSIRETPGLLELRPPIVYPLMAGGLLVIAGEMRSRAAQFEGHKEIPVIILDANVPVEFLKEITIKDNAHFGEWDMDELANGWADEALGDWGLHDRAWHPSNLMNDEDVDLTQEFDPIGLSSEIQRVVFVFDNDKEADRWLQKWPELQVKKTNGAWQVNLSTLYT